ncbi:MAG: SDR family NAD(P)-dependent oxidoreductase, partial [Maribacter sp.]
MNLNLTNKVVVVTGAAGLQGSIGHSIVFALAKEGAIPVLIDRNNRGFDYEKQLQEIHKEATFYQTDLTIVSQIEDSITKVSQKFGRIDAIINNVGVNDGVSLEGTIDEFMDSLRLNLVSYFAVVKYALPLLKKSRGTILNI